MFVTPEPLRNRTNECADLSHSVSLCDAMNDGERELERGQVLEHRYVIERPLGRGGLGSAYAASDRVLDCEVALKLLRDASPARIDVLRREFLLLSRLAHAHLTRVQDFGRSETVRGTAH